MHASSGHRCWKWILWLEDQLLIGCQAAVAPGPESFTPGIYFSSLLLQRAPSVCSIFKEGLINNLDDVLLRGAIA